MQHPHNHNHKLKLLSSLLLTAAFTTAIATAGTPARADVITDWNAKTNELITEAKIGTPPAVRISAIVQTAALKALERLPRGASADAAAAAVAAAHLGTLVKLLPAQQAQIEAAVQTALTAVADGPAKKMGLVAGDKAAAEVLAQRLDDGAATPDSYRPHTTAGAYVPTATVAITTWSRRKPWHLTSSAQFRPGPPPALSSEAWARDYNEVRTLGSRTSTQRTPEQTEIARFWDYSLPAVYHGVLRSVALQPERSPLANARLFATAAQAMDDALIADG
ncbi:MAG TPA: PA-phosphatase, partial [Rubrivivax sp.]|nr:PA-phosphatase [Rubrivivax sp.]